MNLAMIFRLIPMVIKLMALAEQAFDSVPDSGADKKRMVLEAVKAVLGVVIDVSSGGQAETWKTLEPIISKLIDLVCDFLFPHDDETDEQEIVG